MNIRTLGLATLFAFGAAGASIAQDGAIGRPTIMVSPSISETDTLLSQLGWQGYVAYDAGGKAIDIFGPRANAVFAGNELSIEGYELPEGGSIRAEGAFGVTQAARQLAATAARSPEPSPQQIAINQTVDSISASNNSVEAMCANPIYPSKITLRVKGSAGMPGFGGAEAEATVEWDLAALCSRIKAAAIP